MPQPFIKFFPSDWEADAGLMGCSLSARGLWLHMLRVMHEAEPYGFFIGRNGEPIVVNSFALRIGALTKDVRKAFDELDAAGVFSRDSQGRIYCRRMLRDEAKRQQLLQNGEQSSRVLPSSLGGQKAPQAAGGACPPASLYSEAQKLRGLDSDSLRSSAEAFGSWPADVTGLRRLGAVFLAAFANCFDPLKVEKYLPPYTQALATMRSRGVTISEAWQACVDAREANNNKPLFSAAIKTAISFLPAARHAKTTPSTLVRELT